MQTSLNNNISTGNSATEERTSSINGAKKQLLRELNAETHSLQVALNQTQQSLTHLTRLVEHTYQRKRKQIMNGHYDEEAL